MGRDVAEEVFAAKGVGAKNSYRTVTLFTSLARELALIPRSRREGVAVTEYLPLEAIVLLGAISEPEAAIRPRPTLAWELDERTGKPVGRWIMVADPRQAARSNTI